MTYAEFVHEVVDALRQRPFRQSSLDYFLRTVPPEIARTGEWVEFGCWSGRTIKTIADRRIQLGGRRVVHDFDSFQGLPEKWRNATTGGKKFEDSLASKGSFDRHGKPPFEDASRVQWHIGWYNETASAFGSDAESLAVGNVTFAHMDADIYSSTEQVFKAIEHRFAPGVFLVFDELIGYPEYKEHEMKALYELLQRGKRTLKVIGYPGPVVLESPDDIRKGICKQGGEHGAYPQSALVQLM